MDDEAEMILDDMADEVGDVSDDEEEAYMAGVRDDAHVSMRTAEIEDKEMLTSKVLLTLLGPGKFGTNRKVGARLGVNRSPSVQDSRRLENWLYPSFRTLWMF